MFEHTIALTANQYTDELDRHAAWVIAQVAHHGQVDKAGESYIGHPIRVACEVGKLRVGVAPVIVAYLHDVIEDTHVTLESLEGVFDPEVIEALDAITKRPGEPFKDYYERVKGDSIATVVKWHDVADNAREDRLALVAPDTQDRLRAKYERARDELRAAYEREVNGK